MFGYELIRSEGQVPFVIQMATPEKAIIDLLHLYPDYSTTKTCCISEDEDYMQDEIDLNRMLEYEMRIQSPALSKRIKQLKEAYDLL